MTARVRATLADGRVVVGEIHGLTGVGHDAPPGRQRRAVREGLAKQIRRAQRGREPLVWAPQPGCLAIYPETYGQASIPVPILGTEWRVIVPDDAEVERCWQAVLVAMRSRAEALRQGRDASALDEEVQQARADLRAAMDRDTGIVEDDAEPFCVCGRSPADCPATDRPCRVWRETREGATT